MRSSCTLFYLDWAFKIPEESVRRSLSLRGEKPLGLRLGPGYFIEEAGCRPWQHPQKFLIFSLTLP